MADLSNSSKLSSRRWTYGPRDNHRLSGWKPPKLASRARRLTSHRSPTGSYEDVRTRYRAGSSDTVNARRFVDQGLHHPVTIGCDSGVPTRAERCGLRPAGKRTLVHPALFARRRPANRPMHEQPWMGSHIPPRTRSTPSQDSVAASDGTRRSDRLLRRGVPYPSQDLHRLKRLDGTAFGCTSARVIRAMRFTVSRASRLGKDDSKYFFYVDLRRNVLWAS